MKKIFVIITCTLFLLVGCSSRDKVVDKIYLDEEYYSTGNFINIKNSDLSDLKDKNYVLFTNNNYCSMAIPCDKIFLEFMKKYKIDFIYMSFDDFKKTTFHKKIKYAPSVLVVNKCKIIAYLDANLDDDLEKYQDVNKFEDWISKYIYFSK